MGVQARGVRSTRIDVRSRTSCALVALCAVVTFGACSSDPEAEPQGSDAAADAAQSPGAGAGGTAGSSGAGDRGGAAGSGAVQGNVDAGARDGGGASRGGNASDAAANESDASADASVSDGSAGADAAGQADAGPGSEASAPVDGSGGTPDATPAEAAPVDDVSQPPNGLSVPCQNGPGWTLFRFHYQNSTTASIDVWDASCSYSLSASSQCLVEDVGSLEIVAGGTAVNLNGSDVIRIRYSVATIAFTQATVYVQARSFSTSASTNIELWSPIYGSAFGGPVDQDFVYDWYAIAWSNFLSPADLPGLTAIEIAPSGGSANLAVRAVELCLR